MAQGQRTVIATRACGVLLAFMPLLARADCLDEASSYWGVPPLLARAIATHESHMRADAVHRNADGSRDIGLMQVNSSWLPILARYGVKESDLFDACTNAYVGTWILADNIKRLGFNWNAIGAYNAVSPSKRDTYAHAIYKTLMSLQPAAPVQAGR